MMKTVSFQGTQLSIGQKQRLGMQHRAQLVQPSIIPQLVSDVLASLKAREEKGTPPEVIWSVERQEIGTLCIAEWMGY